MLFNSYVFLFAFLPVTLAGWWLVRRSEVRFAWLTIASYVFYGWWNWHFLPLMIASTTVDYIAGAKIAATENLRTRRGWLVASLSFNLALLAFFKYYGLFASTINQASSDFGFRAAVPVLNIILPIGISFYTFNSMSYTIDIYRGLVRPAKSLLHYSAFVALFPHLIAGPIVRYSDIETQFHALKTKLGSQEASLGIYFFVIGLSKKVLIADRLARPVNEFFALAHPTGLVNSWLAVLGYSLQLYFDFSGYSDMAVGLAHFLGLQFPQNFNSPYQAENIADFWRRWHISLSTWLRDYLFIPLGGSRLSNARTALNLTVTMFLGGLWHGANWTFVVWGLYHGVLLVIHAVARERGWTLRSSICNRSLTFIAIMLGWVLFRAESFGGATRILASMFGRTGLGSVPDSPLYVGWVAGAAAIAFFAPNTWQIEFKPRLIYAYSLAALFLGSVLMLSGASPFLYFQF